MTPEQRTALIAARASGMTWVQVAAACGYNSPQAAYDAHRRVTKPNPYRWTPDEISDLWVAWESNRPIPEIAVRFGVSPQAVTQQASIRGWTRRVRHTTTTERHEIQRLDLAGLTVDAIAIRLNRSTTTIRRMLREKARPPSRPRPL